MKPSIPKSVNSQAAIAELICRQFKIRCEQQDIQHWRQLRGVGSCTIPFPAPGPRNKYTVKTCFAWVEKYIMPTRNGNNLSEREQKNAVAIRIDEKKDTLLGIRIGKEESRLLARVECERIGIDIVTKLVSFYKRTDEQLIPQRADEKLSAIGVTSVQRGEFQKWFIEQMQSVTTQREDEAAKMQAEIKAQLDALADQEKANA